MENGSHTTKVLYLLGLEEMEGLRYLYCPLFSVIYVCILVLSIVIVYVVLMNPSLHEPMYILICNLVLNGIVGSSSFFPKIVTDLWTSTKTISRESCQTQSIFITNSIYFELLTFSVMAYDRYLAVCHPLHYTVLMTNTKVIKILAGWTLVVFGLLFTTVGLTMRLSLCGTQIKNVFCDNMAIFILSCTDTTVNFIYGSFITVVLICSMLSVIIYSYLRTFVACFRLSKESRQKALYTVGTQLINFSVFLLGVLFVFFRNRVGVNNLPVVAHVGLSLPSLVLPPLMNPLVFGVRTKALQSKMVQLFKRSTDF